MGELLIEGNHAEQMSAMKTALRELWNVLKGNGKDGMEKEISTIQQRLGSIDTALATSILWGKILTGIMTLFLLAATVYFASLEYRHKTEMVIPPTLTAPKTTGEVYTASHYNQPQLAKGEHHGNW